MAPVDAMLVQLEVDQAKQYHVMHLPLPLEESRSRRSATY